MFKDRLFYLRKQKKLSQDELGQLIGVSQQAVAKWEGGSAFPNQKFIEQLCEIFGVTMDFLFDNSPNRGTKIPVLNTIIPGVSMGTMTDIDGYEEISEAMAENGTYFAVKINDYAMAPRILPGDISIVQEQASCADGDFCLVQIGGNPPSIRQLYQKTDGLILIALNSVCFPPQFLTTEDIHSLPLRILGIVRELRIRHLAGSNI